jgi:hypothetical protein
MMEQLRFALSGEAAGHEIDAGDMYIASVMPEIGGAFSASPPESA